jgi:ABC-2 type transport system permease protein
VAIVVPLVLAPIFGLIFHNAIGGRITFTLGLVDLDHGPAAQAFVTSGFAPLERSGLITVRRKATLAAGRSAADQNRLWATIVLPAAFSTAIGHGRPATLRVVRNVDAAIGTQVAQSIAQSYADHVDTVRMATAAAGGTAINQASFAAALAPIAIANCVHHEPAARCRHLLRSNAAGMAVFFCSSPSSSGSRACSRSVATRTLSRCSTVTVPDIWSCPLLPTAQRAP